MDTISEKPFQALRFVVMENNHTEEIKWVFANGQVDHAKMEELFQEKNSKLWVAISGGFYTVIRNDFKTAHVKDNYVRRQTMFLFDQSGSIGLHTSIIEETIPVLRKQLGDHWDIKTDYNIKTD